MDKIEDFFHHISPKIISLTNDRFEKTKKVKYKDREYSLNVATEGDFDNEELIKQGLAEWFPADRIIAEESATGKNDYEGRVWIVDPICGSANFKNGIKFFSTNIALAQDGKLIASCVIDHSREEYIWSIGHSQIYINFNEVKPDKKTMGIMVEVDLSALVRIQSERINQHIKMLSSLLHNKNYYLATFCTSLSFAYTALGRIDAYVNGFSNVWDVAAANFLILQAGGIITQLDGEPWTLSSDNVLAARDKKLHAELLTILKS